MALTDAQARRLFALKVARFRLKLAKLRAKRVKLLVRMARSGLTPRGEAPRPQAPPRKQP